MNYTLVIAIFALVTAACLPAKRVSAAELIMVEQENCHWCHKWDVDIGTTYDSTPVGRIAPLRRVDIADPKPADLAGINLGRATPVFILIEDGIEIGRVRGYPGREVFWTLLREQLAKLPSLRRHASPPVASKTGYSSSRNKSRWVVPLYSVR